MRFIKILIAGLIFLIFHSCSDPAEKAEEQNDLLEITQQQFLADGMVIGELAAMPFDKSITCNGYLMASPNGLAVLSLPLSGIIKRVYIINGQQITKGQVLCEVSGNEIIDLQKDYAEAAAVNRRLKSEYERIKLLHTEKISSEKDFILTESDYKSSLARYHALKLKLESVGLIAQSVEQGEFQSFYQLRAPISGHVSQLKVSLGQYVDQHAVVAEIVDHKQMQLKLSVFEKDISFLKMNQKIQYSFVDEPGTVYTGRLQSAGASIDPETKAVFCYGAVDADENPFKVNNAFVEAKILVATDSVIAAPEEALLKTDNDYYLLVMEKKDKDKYYFKKIRVKTGRLYKGFVEIITDLKVKGVLIKGAYNIQIE
ncbi:MAG: efflux RND transporter periplasmic adaptor subunit [Bacteroidales bacterium]